VGRGFSAGEIVDAVETILETYVTLREEGERFIETLRRIGLDPFKERLYTAS
jgi:sulfite reductase (NADPH) hemoprotein beta-component